MASIGYNKATGFQVDVFCMENGMLQSRRPLWLPYALAVGLTVLAFVLTLFSPLQSGSPFLLFLGAVLVSALYGGWGPGLLSTVLSALFSAYFFLAPVHALSIASPDDILRFAIFLVLAIIVTGLTAERERIKEGIALRASEQAAVSALGLAALSSHDVDVLFERAAKVVCETLGVEYCKILELVQDGKQLFLRSGYGWQPGLVGKTTISAGTESQAGYALVSDAPVVVRDLRTETRFAGPAFLLDHGVRSGMSVIVRGKTKPYGVLGAHTKRRRSFSQNDVNFLQSVANVLAMAVERAQAETELQDELVAVRSAQEELRESEGRYRTVTQTAMDGIITVDDAGQIVFVNAGAERIFGYSSEELTGVDVDELIPEVPGEPQSAGLRGYIASGARDIPGNAIQVSGLTKDGRTIPLEISVGEFVRGGRHFFTSVVRDITERRVVEQKLEFQANVLRNVRDSVIVTDLDGNITFWNEGATALFGYTADEMTGQSVRRLYPEQKEQALAEDLARIRGGTDYFGEWKGQHKDGRMLWVSLKATLLCDADGQPVGTIGVASDITQRKRAEERLAAHYAITRALAESDTVAQATPIILQAICEWTGWDVGVIWDLDRTAEVLRCIELWHRPELDVHDFERLSREMLFVHGLGLPGQVWATGRPVWFRDICEAPGMPRAKVASKNQLHGAVGFPITIGEEITGVFEFYSRQARKPDAALVEMMNALGSQIGQFIERKQGERRLELSEEQHSIILQGVADGITAQEPDGQLIYANQAAAEMVGFPSPQALLDTPLDQVMQRFSIQSEDGQPLAQSEMPGRKAILEKQPASSVLRFRVTGEEGERWSVVNATPVLDERGEVRFAINIFHDVTERMRAEDEMRRQRELLRVTLASIGDAVIATDAKGKITFLNPVAEALTGWTFEEAARKPLEQVFDIINEDTRAKVPSPVARVIEERAVVGLANHTLLVAKDGKAIPIDDSAAPIRDDKGNIIGTVLVFRDVTQRRRTEQDAYRLAAVVNSSDDAIISKTLDGIITTWNPAAERMFGYTAEEAVGKPITIIYPPERLPEFETNMARVRRGESIDHFDTVRLRKDGTPVIVSLSISVVRDAHGNVIGASKILRDISERKWNEDAQRFLAEASDVLASSLEYETTLASVARLVVPRIADWCAVHIKMEDGSIQQLALAHVDPAKLELVHEYQRRYPDNPESQSAVSGVIQTGKPSISPVITNEMIRSAVKDFEQLNLLRDIGIRSSMVVPLTARGRTLGALTFISTESGRHFGPADLALANELARRAGMAVDNARLYHEAQSLNEHLEQRVIRRTIELQNANRRLEAEALARQRVTEQLRLLSGHLQSAREEERIRIAREIHDEIGQVLTAVKMDLALLGKEVSGNGSMASTESLHEDIASTTKLVDDAIQTMHGIVRELRPEVLDHLGLHAALEWQVQEFQSRTKIDCQYHSEIGEIDLDAERSTAVFRILQETLTNVARHADATEVEVNVRQTDGQLVLTVQDNGKGISPEQLENTTRFGILGMRERAHAFGGEVTIEGVPDQGTLVTARIPL